MHIGFIVDGNRRWAKAHKVPSIEGHRAGMKAVEMTITELAAKHKEVKFASFYVFSNENWQRSQDEVNNLMNLASQEVARLAAKMAKHNIKLLVVGSSSRVDPALMAKLQQAEASTAHCDGLTVAFCFNYGGQQEIADAARGLALAYKDQAHAAAHQPGQNVPAAAEFFTPEHLSQYLYHPEIPALDLIVRSSGEERLSGFMLWRAAYAEFIFIKKYYPDFKADDISNILAEYAERNRRYGR